MLRSTPPGEDPTKWARALPIPLGAPAFPPGEDGIKRGFSSSTGEIENIENDAQRDASQGDNADFATSKDGFDFLQLVREAEDQAMLYVAQVNRRAWSQSLRAFHNEHYIGSKYTRPDWRGRSKLFVPKTRNAVHKDNAATAASLFNSIDAINCTAGNDSDPRQRASAAIMQELVSYRTVGISGKASFPWFLVANGARQDAVLTGVCMSKQSWKLEFRKVKEEKALVADPVTGVYSEKSRDVFKVEVDRPDMQLIPPENYVIDPSAQWTNPAQSSAFLILKWPMQIEEIRSKQRAPINPWKNIPEEMLRNAVESGKYDMAAIRRARELGLDRLDETQTGTTFQIIWVYECFMRVDGEDWTFYSVSDQDYLTDPKPVREVYPEQFGERPLALGYGALEAHRIYPMAPAEAWQPLQLEINDLRNLRLDQSKQNTMPISKVRRGRQIDLDQVKRRSAGSSIIVSEPDDVTWETPPAIPPTVVEISRELDLELDDLAGQQNYGSVQTNNALGKTLGGLKLAAGAANAVQEFDVRLWIETWATHALMQIVRLEQYYEHDETVLALCGQKAQLFEKYGINTIDNDLLEQDVTVRVSVGLGAGDPQQRLQKFESAAAVIGPILQMTPEFKSGKKKLNLDAIIEEVFGAVGYKDAGKRFFSDEDQPQPNPMGDLEMRALEARIAKDDRTGKAAIFTGISQLAKVALGKRELEADFVDSLLGHQLGAHEAGLQHADRHHQTHLAALDHGHRHGLAIAQHGLAKDQHELAKDQHQHQVRQDLAAAAQEAAGGGGEGGGAEMGSAAPPAAAPPRASPQGSPSASPPPAQDLQFTRGPDGRLSGFQTADGRRGQFTLGRDGRISGLRMA